MDEESRTEFKSLHAKVDKLVETAISAGGDDNVTVVMSAIT